jgi:hypothetical protein
LEALRQQIRALGGIPTFAAGGMHSGGLRLVGERGPELEVTGPARYWSAADTTAMLGNSTRREEVLAAEIRALRAEVAGLRAETRATAENTGKTRRLWERVTRDGESMQVTDVHPRAMTATRPPPRPPARPAMKVIKPVTFDSATHLVSSTAVEAYAAYNPATTYAKDAFVDYGTFIYQSLVNSNTGNQPDTSPTQWVLIGPDNTHAMFDDQTSTATTSTSPLTVVLDTGLCNSLGLLGLVGSQVVVTVKDDTGGNTVYSRTISLDGTFIYDWYQYFFEPYVQIGEVVLTDLPPYLTAELTVSLTGTGTIQIGTLTWGTQYDLGDATYGAGLGIIDYSKKETDEFGVTTFVRRDFSKRLTARLILPNAQINRVQRVLADLRAQPAIWVTSDVSDLAPLTVYGFFRDFSIEVAYPTESFCSLEIEGLT